MNKNFLLALDKASVRNYDGDGRLHVTLAHISKSNICPYMGKEIPNAEELGLQPDKLYQLLRDPKELEKAAKTSNNIQLLIKHDPVTVADPKKDLVIGSTGTDAVWNAPYLDNSLVVWDEDAIKGIESNQQKELSAGYYYTADMTSGRFEGVEYDGVMRDIRFNHVALVVEGRAGSDVVVGDSMENLTMNRKTLLSRKAAMAKGAIAVCLQPRLAQDAKLNLNSVLTGVSSENWKTSKLKIANYLKALPVRNFTNKVAMDAGIADVVKLLDSLDGEQLGDTPSDDLGGGDPAYATGSADPAVATSAAAKDSPADSISALLKGKISDEDLAQVMQLLQPEAADDDGAPDAMMAKLKAQLQGGKPAAPTPSADPAETAASPDPAAQDEDSDEASTSQSGSGIPQNSTSVGKGTLSNAQVAKPVVGNDPQFQKGTAAMDQAIKKAKDEATRDAVKRMRDIAEAEETVKPLIGKVLAQDTAEAVYRLALDQAGIDVSGVHPSAFKAMVSMLVQNKTDSHTRTPAKIATDSKLGAAFKERYPSAGKVRILG